jgi:translation initiation factor 2 beta subunit (eIF-2beta)/eIF-5
MIPLTEEIRVYLHHGLVKINIKGRLHNVDDIFIFIKQCQQVYYSYTPSKVIGMIPLTEEIRVYLHYGLVKINIKAKLHNVDDIFVFIKQCQQVYYAYTSSFRKDRSRVDWLSIVKTRPRGHVQVV